LLKKIWNHVKRRIKHNDLTHYFMTPHEDLPASYMASCEKFFRELKKKQGPGKTDKQATSEH